MEIIFMAVSRTAPTIKRRFNNLDLKSAYTIVFSARKGIRTEVFYDFASSIRMPEKNLAGILNLTSRTISNYKDQSRRLEPAQSEHLLKLIALYSKGEEVFGNVDEFTYWLQKPFWNAKKAKETPLTWLITPGGVDLVTAELDRLAQGYVV
jgi:putative toxin-antitoxin system antitoxin component (TIGR02293 family)